MCHQMIHGEGRGSIKVSRDIFEQNFTTKSLEKGTFFITKDVMSHGGGYCTISQNATWGREGSKNNP